MAIDSWMPHRFSQLSDRLVTEKGIFMMAFAAAAALLYTKGDVGTLVVMYSINVFITFSLTELGMSRHWIAERARVARWKSLLAIHGTGLVMCASILAVIIFEKFAQGGWITLVVTASVVTLCFGIRAHYDDVRRRLHTLDDILETLPAAASPRRVGALHPDAPTAVISVTSFSGFGLHQVLSIHRTFPNYFKQLVFMSAAVVDSGSFKGADEIARLTQDTIANLERYVTWAEGQGFAAGYRAETGTEAVATVEKLSKSVAREFPRAIFFMGRLVFEKERWFHRLLHNETPHAIQRRLQFAGIQAMVLPIRVFE